MLTLSVCRESEYINGLRLRWQLITEVLLFLDQFYNLRNSLSERER